MKIVANSPCIDVNFLSRFVEWRMPRYMWEQACFTDWSFLWESESKWTLAA